MKEDRKCRECRFFGLLCTSARVTRGNTQKRKDERVQPSTQDEPIAKLVDTRRNDADTSDCGK